MELRRSRTRRSLSSSIATLLFCACLCFISASALLRSHCSYSACLGRGSGSRRALPFFQGIGVRELGGQGGGEGWGPGSYPPRCTSKCGECSPCKPVHVPVPQGTPVITEYYPEAWRCKCNNKLYMP